MASPASTVCHQTTRLVHSALDRDGERRATAAACYQREKHRLNFPRRLHFSGACLLSVSPREAAVFVHTCPMSCAGLVTDGVERRRPAQSTCPAGVMSAESKMCRFVAGRGARGRADQRNSGRQDRAQIEDSRRGQVEFRSGRILIAMFCPRFISVSRQRQKVRANFQYIKSTDLQKVYPKWGVTATGLRPLCRKKMAFWSAGPTQIRPLSSAFRGKVFRGESPDRQTMNEGLDARTEKGVSV
jgi:hypothetical protein